MSMSVYEGLEIYFFKKKFFLLHPYENKSQIMC